MQKIDDDPTPVPKIKGARRDTNVNQVAVIELCHNDEDMIPEGWEDNAMVPDSEDEYIAEQGEGQGPPNVSADKFNNWMKEQHLMKWRSCSRWMSSSPWCLQTVKHLQRMWLTLLGI